MNNGTDLRQWKEREEIGERDEIEIADSRRHKRREREIVREMRARVRARRRRRWCVFVNTMLFL